MAPSQRNTKKTGCIDSPCQNWRACLVADTDFLAAMVYTNLVTSSCPLVGMILCPKAGGRNRCLNSNTRIGRVVGRRRTYSETADTSFEEDMKERRRNCCWLSGRKSSSAGLLVYRKADMCLSSVRRSRVTSLACSVFYKQTC